MHRLTWSLAALAPVIGLTMTFSPVAHAGVHPAAAHGAARASVTAAARSALERMLAQHLGHWDAVSSNLRHVQALNIAGYVDDNSTGDTYTYAAGAWTEPTVTCPASGTAAIAFGVGLDGFNTNSLELAGTMGYCTSGSLTSYSWYDLYPNPIVMSGSTVAAGDVIHASVTGPSPYTLFLKDGTLGNPNSFTIVDPCPPHVVCADGSADWIALGLTNGSALYPLPAFTPWHLHAAAVTASTPGSAINAFPDDKITMVATPPATGTLAHPGPLNMAGTAFTVS